MANDIKAMTDALGKDKEEFLNYVESAINAHISAKSWQECLTIVQRYDDGRIRSTREPKVSESYWNRMVAFLRGKRYNGWQLDSKLTDGVVDVVIKKFGEFYQDHAKDLSGTPTQRLLKDRVFSKQLDYRYRQHRHCLCCVKLDSYNHVSTHGGFPQGCQR